MKNKKLALLVLGSMISTIQGEDFINPDKELKNFSSMYDFGAPILRQRDVSPIEDSSFEETNTTIEADPALTIMEQKKEKQINELNITCGAKCGIVVKNDENRS